MTRLIKALIASAALTACAPVVEEEPVVLESPVIAPEPVLERAAPVDCDVIGDGIGGTGCPAID